MHVLVTGAGGFLGSHIVRQLLARGDRVRGFSRGLYPELTSLGMQQVCGDIVDADAVRRACQGIDAVVHTAAKAGVWGRWANYYVPNMIGTQNVLRGCQAHGVPILVYTSSPSVTFDGSDQKGVDESVPYPQKWLCHYPHTKALAEQAVLRANQPGKLQTVSLRPHLIWGEGDPHLLPRLIQRAQNGRLRIVGDGQNLIDATHVENAAGAHLSAMARLAADPNSPAAGRAYFVSQNQPVNCWQWIANLLEAAGTKRPSRQISFKTAWRIGATMETFYRIIGKTTEPPMTRFVAAQLATDHYFDLSAAIRLLGYQPTITNEQGLERLSSGL